MWSFPQVPRCKSRFEEGIKGAKLKIRLEPESAQPSLQLSTLWHCPQCPETGRSRRTSPSLLGGGAWVWKLSVFPQSRLDVVSHALPSKSDRETRMISVHSIWVLVNIRTRIREKLPPPFWGRREANTHQPPTAHLGLQIADSCM